MGDENEVGNEHRLHELPLRDSNLLRDDLIEVRH